MKRIVLIVGARPNYMKAFPVYEALKDYFDVTLIHTGQHFDENMNKVFFEQLNCPKPDINLNLEKKIRAGDLDKKLYIDNEEFLKNKEKVINELKTYEGNLGQLGEIRDKLNEKFQEIKPDMIMVFGDVTSTLAASLTAKNMGIKLAHVESGLRSGDIKMPEEVNRILTDYISDYCFCTEQSGIDNLKNEGKDEDKLFLVGNTMIDTQKKFLNIALKTKYYEKLKLKEKEYVLITLHRPSNVDNLDKLKEIFDDLIELSKTEIIVYPIHPRTKKNLEKLEYLEKINDNKNIILEEPLGYLEFTCLMTNCKYLITDSGGLQEESTALNIPCFTLRENTERPCTLIKNNGTNQLIKRISKLELKESKESMNLWDGKSSNRIYEKLKNINNNHEKNILFAGKDLKFLNNIIEHTKATNNIKLDKWKNHVEHDQKNSMCLLKWADIIFCEWCLGNAIWYSKNKLQHQKLYIRLHKQEITTSYPEQVLWKNVDKIIFIAPKIRDIMVNKIPEIASKSILIYNYVPKSIQTDNNIFSRKYTLGILGYIPLIKRPDLAIKIIQQLVNKDNRFNLIIKGKSPQDLNWIWKNEKEREYYNNLYKYIEDNNLKNNIKFEEHGDVSSWFNKIGYIISCSDIEGSHQAVAEGMQAGCIPMISGKWYYDYGSYLLYPKKYCNKDINEIVDKIMYLSKNEKVYEQESKYCKQYSKINFNEDKIKNEYKRLLMYDEHENKYINNLKTISYPNKILIYADLNFNIIDGSTVWLTNLINMLMSNHFKEPDITLLLKNDICEKTNIDNIFKSDKITFIEPKKYNKKCLKPEHVKEIIINKDNENYFDNIVIRGHNVIREFNESDVILNKITFYGINDVNIMDFKNVLNSFKLIACQTSFIKDKYIDLGINKDKMVILPPIINFPNIQSFKRNDYNFVYTGTLKDDYCAIEIIECFEELYKINKNICLTIIYGKIYNKPDWFKNKIEKLLKKHEDGTKGIKIYKQLSKTDVNKCINNSDFGICWRKPNMDESIEISTKLLEYASFGKPMILNKNRVNESIFGDKYPYYANSKDEFMRAMKKIMSDDKLYEKTSKEIFNLSKKFNYKTVYNSFYNNLTFDRDHTLHFEYKNLENTNDMKELSIETNDFNKIVDNVYYQNNGKKALIKLMNRKNEVREFVLFNNKHNMANVKNIVIMQSKPKYNNKMNFFITRFSILDKGSRWVISRNNESFDDYKKTLFDEKRLEYKFKSFEKITLKSVLSQTSQNYIWLIYSSIYLPEKYKTRLINICSKYKQIRLKFVKNIAESNKDAFEVISKRTNYTTIRLDDDDGLSKNFLSKVNTYFDKNIDILSFPYGKKVSIKNNEVIIGDTFFLKNNAQGITAFNKWIYQWGHSRVSDPEYNLKVFYDNTPDMYLLNCSEFCDTQRSF